MDTLPWMINGEYQQFISADSRGYHYGDGLFETIRVQDQVALNLPMHIQRMHSGLRTLGIAANLELIESQVQKYMHQLQLPTVARLKIIVSRGGAARGYSCATSAPAHIAIGCSPYEDVTEELQKKGIQLRFCAMRLSLNPVLAGIKHLNRLEQVLARAEWQDDRIFEGLMFDTDDNLVEGTMSNLFLVVNDVLRTPAIDRCGVSGVMRREILDRIAPELGIDTEVGRLTRHDLRAADEVFITNSLIGSLSCRQCEDLHWAVGPMRLRIQNAIDHYRARSARHLQ